MDWSVAIVVWIACGLINVAIAQSRQAGALANWFVFGVLLGPLGVLYALVSAKPKPGAHGPAAVSPPVAAPSRGISVADELAKLVALREAGELTAAEFARQRLNLLGSTGPPPSSATLAPQSPTQPPASMRETSTSQSATPALLAGLSWLIAAALSGYLAYQQWSLSQTLAALGLGDEGLGGYAAWNAIGGLVTLYFAARLLTRPTRRLLDASAAWAVLSVLGGVLQLASGAGNDVFAIATIAAAAAGVLSFVARQAIPAGMAQSAETRVPGWDQQSDALSTTSPSPAARPPSSEGSRTAERVVVFLIILALLGGGALLVLRMQTDQTLAEVASLLAPTERPRTTPRPPADDTTAGLGEIVDLIDGSGADLGSVKVIKNGKPSDLLGIPPASGNRYIAALVNYTAQAAWSYNLFDWAAHDSRQIQYQPLGLAPNPPLAYGTLSAGRQVEAWVAFEIPASVRDVWLDYQPGGNLIFSVKVD